MRLDWDPPAVAVPGTWDRRGLVLRRPEAGGTSVAGDPAVVWDEEAGLWRMFLFLSPGGHGHATCAEPLPDPGTWQMESPLAFTNPADLLGGTTHKPWVVTEARRPNRAARVDGRFWLLTVSGTRCKQIQRAWAERLRGPWTVEPGPLIPVGPPGAFDARHTDAVTGYHFPERNAFLYFYMGYPDRPQPRAGSRHGSAQGAAVHELGAAAPTKLGVILPPSPSPGHWASGWVGGLQLLPGVGTRWVGLANASPTAPDPGDAAVSREEPPPSLGGFALCGEEWPVSGWRWADAPIEWVADIPAGARATGEGDNLWRHHALVRPDGSLSLYYNSGPYGREQLYAKAGRA